MKRWAAIQCAVLAILMVSVGLQSCTQETGIGDTLLDDYLRATSAKTAREASASKMRAALDDLDSRVRADQAKLPAEFVERYRRMIATSRILMTNHLTSEDERQLHDYMKSITGKAPPASDVIPALVDATLMEISQLRALLHKR